MGRMLDMLRGTEKAQSPIAGECVVDWSLPEVEEIPFIEVGGGKKLEASARVLAVPHPSSLAHPSQPTQPPHAPTLKQLPTSPPVVELAPAAPLQVALEPWPKPQATRSVVSKDVVAFHQPDHAAARQYRSLLEQMLGQGEPVECPCLLLAGMRQGIGTSTVLANLGVPAASQAGRRTALMEIPGRDGGAARLFGLGEGQGIREVLAGSSALDQAVHSTAVEGLFVLPAGKEGPDTVPMTSSAAAWLIAWLRQRFDLILIEGPTLDQHETLAMMAPLADSLYLVAGAEDKHLLPRDLARNLTRMGGRLRGVLNTSLTA